MAVVSIRGESMAIKFSEEQTVEFLEMIKPKIKKELSQTTYQDRDDLEQEIILFVVETLKKKEFEEIDLFELLNQKVH